MKHTFFWLTLAAAISGCAATQHTPLTETGQATFAAIEEAVAKLNADPSTDWTRVDIDALREHLLDMDKVTVQTTVKSTHLPDGVRHVVTAKGDVLDSLHRMTQAHATSVHAEDPWSVLLTPTSSGTTLDIRSSSDADIERIRALGFYGWLALGAHHQAHHWAMARGVDPHQH